MKPGCNLFREMASLKQKQRSEQPCLINQNKGFKDAIRPPPDCIFAQNIGIKSGCDSFFGIASLLGGSILQPQPNP